MKLRTLYESSKKRIRLFHGTVRSNLKSILRNGLDISAHPDQTWTEIPKVFFSPSIDQLHDQAPFEIIVEVIIDPTTPKLGAPWLLNSMGQENKNSILNAPELHPNAKKKAHTIYQKYDPIDPITKWDLKDREFWYDLEARITKARGFTQEIPGEKQPMGLKELFLNRSVGFKGKTRIIAIYETDDLNGTVQHPKITKIHYQDPNVPLTLAIGQTL